MSSETVLDPAGLEPVAIAIERITLTKKTKVLKVVGIDLDSGRWVALKITSLKSAKSIAAQSRVSRLVLTLTISRLDT